MVPGYRGPGLRRELEEIGVTDVFFELSMPPTWESRPYSLSLKSWRTTRPDEERLPEPSMVA